MSKYFKRIALAIVILFFATIPVWLKSPYYLDVLIIVIIYSLLAMTFVLMFRSGMINVAIQVFWGIGAYASAIMVMKGGMSFWLAMPAAALVAAIIAFALSFLLLRNIGFQFITLSMVLSMLFVVMVGNSKFLGAWPGLLNIPPPDTIRLPGLPPIEFVSKVQYFYLLLFLAILIVVAFAALYNSSVGRAWRAIGLNYRLAETLGVNVFRYRTVAFCIANGTAGLLGAFFAHYQLFIMPNTFAIFKGLYISMYAILGGIEYVFLGPILGTFMMVVFPEVMRVTRAIEPIITGFLIIVVVAFFPKGILSLRFVRPIAADPFGKLEKLLIRIKARSKAK